MRGPAPGEAEKASGDMGREGVGLTAAGKRCHLVVTAVLLRPPPTSGQASRPLQAPTLNGHPDSGGPCLPLVGSLSFGVVLGIEPKASRVPSTHPEPQPLAMW